MRTTWPSHDAEIPRGSGMHLREPAPSPIRSATLSMTNSSYEAPKYDHDSYVCLPQEIVAVRTPGKPTVVPRSTLDILASCEVPVCQHPTRPSITSETKQKDRESKATIAA